MKVGRPARVLLVLVLVLVVVLEIDDEDEDERNTILYDGQRRTLHDQNINARRQDLASR